MEVLTVDLLRGAGVVGRGLLRCLIGIIFFFFNSQLDSRMADPAGILTALGTIGIVPSRWGIVRTWVGDLYSI